MIAFQSPRDLSCYGLLVETVCPLVHQSLGTNRPRRLFVLMLFLGHIRARSVPPPRDCSLQLTVQP